MDIANSLEVLIKTAADDFSRITDIEWNAKPNPRKWSKKEILGHLVDSAMNNLRRFTEIQFASDRPYRVQKYRQEDLVRVNRYQSLAVNHIIVLWASVNTQITFVLQELSAELLATEILTPEGEIKTLGWLVDDYVVHLRHHLAQIFSEQ